MPPPQIRSNFVRISTKFSKCRKNGFRRISSKFGRIQKRFGEFRSKFGRVQKQFGRISVEFRSNFELNIGPTACSGAPSLTPGVSANFVRNSPNRRMVIARFGEILQQTFDGCEPRCTFGEFRTNFVRISANFGELPACPSTISANFGEKRWAACFQLPFRRISVEFRSNPKTFRSNFG